MKVGLVLNNSAGWGENNLKDSEQKCSFSAKDPGCLAVTWNNHGVSHTELHRKLHRFMQNWVGCWWAFIMLNT